MILNYGSAQLLIVVLVECVLYLKTFELNNINRELLLSIVGVLFSVFLMCISPMPGWFVWIVPFVFIYFTRCMITNIGCSLSMPDLTLYICFTFDFSSYRLCVSLCGTAEYGISKSAVSRFGQCSFFNNDSYTIGHYLEYVSIWRSVNSLYKRSSTHLPLVFLEIAEQVKASCWQIRRYARCQEDFAYRRRWGSSLGTR